MRDSIAQAFARVGRLLPHHQPGRHTAAYFAALPAPVPSPYVSPWARPTKKQAREFFRTQPEVLDCLLAERPPGAETALCCICTRETAAPVEVRPGVLTCPEHIFEAYANRVVIR
uniref:Uncharacterized protein n=1 Tax=Streptomyces sp. ML694-90F3 TaxID=1265536 RepID=A0A077KSW5_9ACTN|nr:hypothetical protein [Streptomyces sp. ML694-90F3]